ncbi:hypothetical protein PVL30_000016 [Lodderomyces elongisporus]|uniref:Uncharacterized protein n=1 Tax=Lodderomyces elongisporus (strain ATCC 11503 / CBS 2605 / JCM 1781 / NBRC 1676 / NRRL YB-4239) TaxID=379508 RepID=A5DRM5_LODEL|nr:uncharacterized protein PVL30_000016 [Lodderomyces elongisporus]EDK41833.1 hypothetical protein LELG_00011 [Lodderomyces elongisporus NRRL YB-4239]WLF76315.1 hypothetical protein PVL30_000016 [Lodderomyces elongisporus]
MFRSSVSNTLRHTRTTPTLQFSRNIASNIANGQKGQKTWPNAQTVKNVFVRDIKAIFGWGVAFSAIMIWGPYLNVKTSDYIDDVPKEKGEQVTLKRTGLDSYETKVDIPQTYVSFDKEEEDDDE